MSFLKSPFNPYQYSSATANTRNISSIDPRLSRTNYYDGRLLKASDLIRDQLYLDERLREVGKVLGQGIVRGLELALGDDGVLTVQPGLAVTPSGRVLELEATELSVNLLARDKIASLNEGFRYLERGLYAVVLQYAEEGRGSAEIYPRDLEGERGFHFNAFAEGVELVLTPLRNRLPYARQLEYHRLNNSVLSRSALVRELILPNRGQPDDISEEGVALGLMAVENGSPVWLDMGLVRRPHRLPLERNALQTDLFQHYQELLVDVLKLRNQSIRQNAFPASHYFDVLPPFGNLPKDCIDPVNGYQTYFPQHFEVSISPVRTDDLEAIVQQSLPLEPIDFARDKDVDIMVLVPMDDNNFAFRARQLQHITEVAGDEEFVLPPHFDDYQLRAYGVSSLHAENTDSAVWADIWASTTDIYYVRRPTRVAETQVSAIVLATGDYEDIAHITSLPPGMEEMATQIESLEGDVAQLQTQVQQLQNQLAATQASNTATINALNQQIANLNTQIARYEAQISDLQGQLMLNRDFITRVLTDNEVKLPSLDALFETRPATDDRAIEAFQKLAESIQEGDPQLALVHQLMLIMPQRFDNLNWPTLMEVFAEDLLQKYHDDVAKTTVLDFLETMINIMDNYPFADETREGWLAQQPRIKTPLFPALSDLTTITIRPVEELLAARTDISPEISTSLAVATADNPALLESINKLDAVVDEKYKTALYASLPTLVETDNVDAFLDYAVAAKEKGLPLGVTVGATNTTYKLKAAERKVWTDADLQQ